MFGYILIIVNDSSFALFGNPKDNPYDGKKYRKNNE
jgi:hypothetical protein